MACRRHRETHVEECIPVPPLLFSFYFSFSLFCCSIFFFFLFFTIFIFISSQSAAEQVLHATEDTVLRQECINLHPKWSLLCPQYRRQFHASGSGRVTARCLL